jgi:hypothetical protein
LAALLVWVVAIALVGRMTADIRRNVGLEMGGTRWSASSLAIEKALREA